MLTLTASEIDFRLVERPERHGDRTLVVALGASLLLHTLAITLLPGLRVTPPAEPKPLTVELQQLPPPEPQVIPQPHPLPPKPVVEPKPLPRPEPPPVIERIEPLPKHEPEAFTAPPPPPRVEPTPQAPVVEPPPVPRAEPQPEVKAQLAPPPTPTPAPIVAQPSKLAEPDPALLQGYGQQLSRLLAKVQRYPRIARMRNWQGTAEVKIHFGADGKAADITLGRASGFEVLDREALDMVKDSLPLPPPPGALQGREFTINVPITFRLQ